MTCKRTHQLKRCGDYWTYARTECNAEVLRKKTTTTNSEVTCPNCLRSLIMKEQEKVDKMRETLNEVEPSYVSNNNGHARRSNRISSRTKNQDRKRGTRSIESYHDHA